MKNPTLEEWKQLYEAAAEFKESQCWTWMYNDNIFGVEDPQTGQVAYCSIMGNAGQLIGVAAYLGDEGLLNLNKLLLTEDDNDDFNYTQRCFLFSYGDRDELETKDLKVIKALGLKFRGKGQWPQFRDYSPGLLPWFIDAEACRFLTHIIRQAVEVAARCKTNQNLLLDFSAKPKLLLRVPATGTDSLVWKDEYREVEAKARFLSFAISDEILLKRLKNLRGKSVAALEVETFYYPAPVAEKSGDRPYFPQMCLFVDHQNGMVLCYKNFMNLKEDGHQCLDGLVESIMHLGAIPAQMLVRKEETYYLFRDVCQQLGIELIQVDELELLGEVKEELFAFMD